VIDWLKWYLSVPIKALARVIVWIIDMRAIVRSKWKAIDLQQVVAWGTIATGIAWVAIFVVADDADRSALTDAVKSMMDSIGDFGDQTPSVE